MEDIDSLIQIHNYLNDLTAAANPVLDRCSAAELAEIVAKFEEARDALWKLHREGREEMILHKFKAGVVSLFELKFIATIAEHYGEQTRAAFADIWTELKQNRRGEPILRKDVEYLANTIVRCIEIVNDKQRQKTSD